jgi:hypothetical protein
MQKPKPDDKDVRSRQDERPPILVGNPTMFLQIERDGTWQRDGADGKRWTAKDDRERTARDLRVRVRQGNAACQDFRRGANVNIMFGNGDVLNVTLAGRDPHVVSTVPLNEAGAGRLQAAEPSPVRRVTVAGHPSCDVSGTVEIEICLKGDRC